VGDNINNKSDQSLVVFTALGSMIFSDFGRTFVAHKRLRNVIHRTATILSRL